MNQYCWSPTGELEETSGCPHSTWLMNINDDAEYLGHGMGLHETWDIRCSLESSLLWGSSSSLETQRPTQHIIGHFVDDFYRPDDQTNSVKALKETSWSSWSGLNPTRTTPPCYNNTTLGNCLYAQCKGPNVTNPICLTCKNCSHKCAADCEHCVTQSSTEQFW